MKTHLRLASAIALAFFASATLAAEFFVAPNGNANHPGTANKPFATIVQARDAVRVLKASRPLQAPVTVWIAGGTYTLEEPISFGPRDSGSEEFPVLFKAVDGQQPVIDGGRKVSGWQRHDPNLWVVTLPEFANRKRSFHQLYINGEQRTRARIPNAGYLRVAACPEGTPKTTNYHTDCKSFEFKPGDIRSDWTNLCDVETIVYHFWTDSHLPIQEVDEQKNLVTFAHKAGKVFTDDFTEDGARYIVENVFEGLDSPGEWYLNRETGQLFYFPLPGEDMTNVLAVVPVAPSLIEIHGDLAKHEFVEHLQFEGLAFTHTQFELPRGNSNDRQGSASVPAAVALHAAKHCRFQNCLFSGLGTWAIDVTAGCSANQFLGNEIANVAAGGIRIDGGTEKDPPWHRSSHNQITDNHLHHYGVDYPSAVGMLLANTESNRVAHNDIHHGGYTGISVGWVWGYQRSISQNNQIEYNHIHDIGGVLSDMGGIYTLGVSPGTVIRNNHIHDVTANHYGGWGIYHDEGSTHLLVENNVVHHTKFAPFNIHYAKEVTVRNNIFAYGMLEQISRGKSEPHKSVFFENNLVYWRDGELLTKNWKDAPYTFHFHPKQESGTREVTSTFEFDWNLYFNPNMRVEEVRFAGDTWKEWQARGKDKHSRYADPLFADPASGDFTLSAASPAFELGFQPIDLSGVGPRCETGP
ncbi:right-handed parallel beta-helix repeat-containing protein [Novipirellula artificiosorum]|uniref:Uncharacterized protein n=1 Tax=Novipirellula artificiosorum TaxID=2528016 RepID=A0A5C6DXY4_9BACT|nr:right-handed parallel beta-helix repeat-containing protein [Novipirellula artificiosorum]TWU42303.1 hypothetical protein Poly41_05990 [Novipirellula artificiosorum]